MKNLCRRLAIVLLLVAPSIHAADGDLVAWWRFDETSENKVRDEISGIEDAIQGNFKSIPGAAGFALKLDGFTTVITREASASPVFDQGFTIEAWLALGAYPWNECPILCRRKGEDKGYAFEIGPRGELNLRAALDGQWAVCTSKDFEIPLRTWVHVAGTWEEGKGLKVFINGREAGTSGARGRLQPAEDAVLRIGMVHAPRKPSHIHREFGTLPGWYSLDGILDELKIHGRALAPEEIQKVFALHTPRDPPGLPPRVMPSGPKGPGRFGAYYCKLAYYDEWDALWPVGPDPDVVVRFDESAARVVFWRGTRYSAAWVSENGLWMADQSVEAWNNEEGCFEHMQDRHCRYAHVRIIESSDARVVVHWRYAPVSVHDHLWRVDEKTGRACWVDEYYYIYPDVMGIRNVSWKKGTLGGPRQFQESLPFTHPGQLQGDVVHARFCTVGNMKGEHQDLWMVENPAEEKEGLPEDLTLQIYRLKSKAQPFIIFEPGNRMQYVRDRNIASLSRPGSCNHWPVGQASCDGRTSQAADRPTHFLGFPISYPPVHEDGDRCWWNGLYGMTERPIEELAVAARSWAKAPELVLEGEGCETRGFDRGQRAFMLDCTSRNRALPLKFTLAASGESPVFNPAFVIRGFGDSEVSLRINGEPIRRGPLFRFGFRHRLEGSDLIFWIRKESMEPLHFEIVRQD